MRSIQLKSQQWPPGVSKDLIRRRYQHCRLHLIELLPRLYDNSLEADDANGVTPHPLLLLHVDHGEVVGPDNLSATPDWARPVVAAALTGTP